MTALPASSLVIPTTTAPNQLITVSLAGQACTIHLFTRSIFVPVESPVLPIPAPPLTVPPSPQYENHNPVFIDLYVDYSLIIGGVLVLNNVPIVQNTYLGFVGDLAVIDTLGELDPTGVSARLPPANLQNWWQRNVPLSNEGQAPAEWANSIPGMGARFLLTYIPAA